MRAFCQLSFPFLLFHFFSTISVFSDFLNPHKIQVGIKGGDKDLIRIILSGPKDWMVSSGQMIEYLILEEKKIYGVIQIRP